MTQDQWVVLAFRVVLIAAEAGAVLFAGVYTFLARWHKNPVGKSVVIVDALLGAGLLPSILSLFLQFNRLTSRVSAWLDVAIFGIMAAGLLHRAALWPKLHYGDGKLSYRQAVAALIGEVIARRGRPVWSTRDEEAPPRRGRLPDAPSWLPPLPDRRHPRCLRRAVPIGDILRRGPGELAGDLPPPAVGQAGEAAGG